MVREVQSEAADAAKHRRSRDGSRVDRLEWHCRSIEDFLPELGPKSVDRFNLSDIFEYMSEENYHSLLNLLVDSGRPGGRLLYWNMLAPRSRPESMKDRLQPLEVNVANCRHGNGYRFSGSFVRTLNLVAEEVFSTP